jgi:hypothetical protein
MQSRPLRLSGVTTHLRAGGPDKFRMRVPHAIALFAIEWGRHTVCNVGLPEVRSSQTPFS